MRSAINAITNGAKARDTLGRLKTAAVKTVDGNISIQQLLDLQYNTSVSPISKIHSVVILDSSDEGYSKRAFIMNFEITDIVNGVESLHDGECFDNPNKTTSNSNENVDTKEDK